jgi:hypothetical protein
MFRALLAHLQEAFHKRHLVYCVRGYVSWLLPGLEWNWCLVTWCVATWHHVIRHNTPIHNILSTAPQLSISQKALGTLPEDGNVMPKHVGATIHS